ncbi:5' exonuclease Apollo-like [Hemitrygon akajei]|uniref:5' exonuclease Apollo-like n=1 Tax=Hemitrygon akajei TaxID=2704970 RepID=UPI003BF9644F
MPELVLPPVFTQKKTSHIVFNSDFRYTPTMFCNSPLSTEKIMDFLYLGNTNCDPESVVPSREEATEQIKEIINAHPEHNVVIGLYNLGKESLLIELALAFKTWIVVRPRRLQMFQLLRLSNVFTSEIGAGRIGVVDQNEINRLNMVQWNQTCPTIAIIPTSRRIKLAHKDIHIIPYSDHSSFQELQEFVARLKPCSIRPIVKGKACHAYFSQCLSTSDELKPIQVPETVERCMKKNWKHNEVLPHRFLKSRPLDVPRGVVFESPEKGLHDRDGADDLCTEELSWCYASLKSFDAVVEQYFKRRNKRKKGPSPDRVPGRVQKTCDDQLAGVFIEIFSLLRQQSEDLTCFKQTSLIPVPEKNYTVLTGVLNQYRQLVDSYPLSQHVKSAPADWADETYSEIQRPGRWFCNAPWSPWRTKGMVRHSRRYGRPMPARKIPACDVCLYNWTQSSEVASVELPQWLFHF